MSKKTPAKVRRADAAEAPRSLVHRKDGWENILTGLGTARDKRSGGKVAFRQISYVECEAFWRGDDMGGKIVEEPAREAVRRWLDIQVQGEKKEAVSDTKDIGELAEKELDRLKARARVREGMMRQRAYGGAAILIGADDGAVDPSEPLREDRLKRIEFLTVFDAYEVYPRSYYVDPMEDKYGEPETYWVFPQGVPGGINAGAKRSRKLMTNVVHESRIIRLMGVQVSRRAARENRGWGDPVFVRIEEVLRDFGMSFGGVSHLLQDFGQAVFKMRGLAAALAANDTEAIRARLEVMDVSRAVLRALALDAGDGAGAPAEDFERKTTPVAGLAELLDRMCNRLAAAADMPVSRLMGQAPAGLNATGQADVTWWYNRIEGVQDEVLLEPMTRLVELVFKQQDGPSKGKVPENWSVVFRPLVQLDPLQESDRRLKIAQADVAYVAGGILLAEEVAVSRFGGDGYSADTNLAKDVRDKYGGLPEEPEPTEPPSGAEPPDEGEEPLDPDDEPPAKDEPAEGKKKPPAGSGPMEGQEPAARPRGKARRAKE